MSVPLFWVYDDNCSGWVVAAGYCEHGDELLGSTKAWEYPDNLSDWWVSKTVLHRVNDITTGCNSTREMCIVLRQKHIY
jgi:hypothetical protein